MFAKHTSFDLPTGINLHYSRGHAWMSNGRYIVATPNLDLDFKRLSAATANLLEPLRPTSMQTPRPLTINLTDEQIQIVEALQQDAKIYTYDGRLVLVYSDGLRIINQAGEDFIPLAAGTKTIVDTFATKTCLYAIYNSYKSLAEHHTYHIYKIMRFGDMWHTSCIASLASECPLFICDYRSDEIYYIERPAYGQNLQLKDIHSNLVRDLELTCYTCDMAHILLTGQLVLHTYREVAEVHVYADATA